MRQQQGSNKNRSRGRGRKQGGGGGNSLSRNYESNGPDVKIRGNASHIAEKYQNLARDALSSGDTVMAENYFQHAEHYNRIVAAIQQQIAENQQQKQERSDRGDRGDRNADTSGASGSGNENAPQPEIDGTPAEVALGEGAEKRTSQEQSDEAPRRRNTRSRRPRNDDGSEDAAANGAANGSSADQPEAEAKEEKPARKRRAKPVEEDVSEDAAMLPSSITGTAVAE